MPREIIDTASSRPTYQRRLAVRWVVALVLLAAAAFAGFSWMKAHRATSVNLAPVPHYRSIYAA